MRRLAITFCLVVAVSVAIAGFKVIHAQSGFSNASLSGEYLMTTTGSDSTVLGFNVLTQPLNVSCFAPTAPSGANLESASITVLVPNSNTSGPNINCSAAVGSDHPSFVVSTPLQVEADFQADGNGNILSGTGTVNKQGLTTTNSSTYTVADSSCDFTFTGSYAIGPTGTGTVTMSPTGSCIAGPVAITFRVRLTNGGSGGILSLNAATQGRFNTILTGTLLKR